MEALVRGRREPHGTTSRIDQHEVAGQRVAHDDAERARRRRRSGRRDGRRCDGLLRGGLLVGVMRALARQQQRRGKSERGDDRPPSSCVARASTRRSTPSTGSRALRSSSSSSGRELDVTTWILRTRFRARAARPPRAGRRCTSSARGRDANARTTSRDGSGCAAADRTAPRTRARARIAVHEQVLLRVPAADRARHATTRGLLALDRLRPALPWMTVERTLAEGRELLEQLLAPLRGEARRDADVLQVTRVVVQAEQEGADAVAVLVDAVAADHAIGGATMLHLHHHPLVRPIREARPASRRRRRAPRPRNG